MEPYENAVVLHTRAVNMELNLMAFLCLFVLFALSNVLLPIDQPKTNVWITLADASGLDTNCLTHTSPENFQLLWSVCQ